MKQLTHYTTNFNQRTFPIALVCDNITNAPNIGSMFRIADAFGVEKLILCGKDISLGRKMKKTSRATENSVNYEFSHSTFEVIQSYKNENYRIITLEITGSSQPMHKFQFLSNKPIALVIGDENFGVSNDIIKLSDDIIHINMFGQNSSMNVVQATNIALYEITRQLL